MAKAKSEAVIEDGAVYILQAGTPVYVKTADVCSMTGKTNQWIGQLVSQGILNKRATSHGSLFELTSNIRSYCGMLENRIDDKSEDEMKHEKALSAANITLKASKAAIAKIELEELQGKMHRSEDVAAMTEDLIYTIRGMLMALPGRLAIDVISADSAAEASEIIKKEVHQIMRELSTYRYDPQKYKERVRERRSWDRLDEDDE